MSFFSKLAAIFGFGPDDPEEPQGVDAPAAEEGQYAGAPLELSDQEVTHIFDRVVEVFNAAQPAFIAKSLDPERQKALLLEALDESSRQYLAGLKQAAQAECHAQWTEEKDKLVAEAEALKKRAEELESKSADIKEKQISADRQKRALADRVHDLEAQVMALEAEKEQLEMENKCMVNRTKAAAVFENEIEELKAENEALRKNSGAAGADIEAASAMRAERDTLKAENEHIKEAVAKAEEEAAALAARVDELQTQLQATLAEKKRLADSIDLTKVKGEMSDAMLNGLQKEASEAKIAAKALGERVTALESELQLKEARIADLRKELDERQAIDDDPVTREQLEEIMRQVEQFEGVKQKMDARIEKLRASLQTAQKENESLRATVRNNLLDHAQEQKRLRAEIAELKAGAEAKAAEEKKEEGEEIDELLSGTDWLVATPAEDVSMRVEEERAPFGYQAPQRRNKVIDNDAQMSLFD